MLVARARPWHFEHFQIFSGKMIVGEVKQDWRGNGHVLVGDKVYFIHRDRISHQLLLTERGRQIACSSMCADTRGFDVRIPGADMRILSVGFWRRRYRVIEQHGEVGKIRLTGMRGRIAMIDLPEQIELQYILFMAALCLGVAGIDDWGSAG